MSKVNALRRKAVDAVRSQKWDEAIKLYERICGADTNNASYRNELGDIYLKKGEIPSAIQAFKSAAKLYVSFGLTNNAIAVHKKILRHDPGNLDSLWGLGEIRRQQGLDADASTYFQNFLQHAPFVTEETRKHFLDCCEQLLQIEAGDLQVLSELESVFRNWKLAEEHARVFLVKARLAKESGELDLVDKYVEHARELVDDLETLVEFRALSDAPPEPHEETPAARDVANPPTSKASPPLDVGRPSRPVASFDPSLVDLDLGFDLGGDLEDFDADDLALGVDDLSFDDPSLDDDDDDENLDEQDRAIGEAPEPAAADAPGNLDGPRASLAPAPTPTKSAITPPGKAVDLLAEILGDGGIDLSQAEAQQVSSIANDVQGQIAAQVAVDDYKGQYEVGLVFLDMGLYEQAAAAFSQAARGEDQRLKALEMQGSCLNKVGRHDDAMRVLQQGLSTPGYPSRFYLGLLYEAGISLESLGRSSEARDYYLRVAAVDGAFLDVVDRLAQLDTHA